MKLDPAQLEAEADAKELRLRSPLWNPDAVGDDGVGTAGVTIGEVVEDGRPIPARSRDEFDPLPIAPAPAAQQPRHSDADPLAGALLLRRSLASGQAPSSRLARAAARRPRCARLLRGAHVTCWTVDLLAAATASPAG